MGVGWEQRERGRGGKKEGRQVGEEKRKEGEKKEREGRRREGKRSEGGKKKNGQKTDTRREVRSKRQEPKG